MTKQVAHIVREIINIDRDYEDGDTKYPPSVRLDIIITGDEDFLPTDRQVIEFHESIDDYIRKYRHYKEGRD